MRAGASVSSQRKGTREPSSDSAAVTVLFDSDCGFCERSARLLRRLDRARRLRVVPLHAASAVGSTLSHDRLLQTMHVIDQDGRVYVGGAAWLRIADVVPRLRPLAVIGRWPPLCLLVEPTYRLVATNRNWLSRLFGGNVCVSHRGPA
ncbi:MAG: thiol-disulfide oxidoreductase DCC family protein [Candidatus Limnocylindrales bacterium]